ncbi:hypothetical protein CGRA01v4_05944 [Colletotrichum graminicola]|nr:hypothetical protein CGRA01v4_05944 [Colletotrichum graminicola]
MVAPGTTGIACVIVRLTAAPPSPPPPPPPPDDFTTGYVTRRGMEGRGCSMLGARRMVDDRTASSFFSLALEGAGRGGAFRC